MLTRLEENMDVLWLHGPIMADGQTANSIKMEQKPVNDCQICTPWSTGYTHIRIFDVIRVQSSTFRWLYEHYVPPYFFEMVYIRSDGLQMRKYPNNSAKSDSCMVTCLPKLHVKLIGEKSQAPSYKVEITFCWLWVMKKIKMKLCRGAVKHSSNISAGTELNLNMEYP